MLIRKQGQQNRKCSRSSVLILGAFLFAQFLSFDVLAANNSIPKHLDCPAGRIAFESQKIAIQSEMKRVNDMANDSQDISDELGQCLGGLSVSIKIPTFPSIQDILDKIKEEACKVARSQVDEHIRGKIPSSIDPWKYVSDEIPDSKYREYIPGVGRKNININTKDQFKDSSAFPWSI
ncbi:hypothetical protein [Xenorhabdus stockiae]|uniref:hypothetical protein n=1 Tax=Xenorhabdus stockiae TaxID=351614 RepID=UPI004064853B